MNPKQYQLYAYRWVVLGVFMFVNFTIQTLWISYAPISGPAAEFYGVSDLQIGFLAMSFMIAFIPLSIPVAWVIDTYGFKLAVNIGVILMAVFGILARFGWRKFLPGVMEYDRDCSSAAFFVECLDESPGYLVCHGRACNSSGIGDPRKFARDCPGNGLDACPD